MAKGKKVPSPQILGKVFPFRLSHFIGTLSTCVSIKWMWVKPSPAFFPIPRTKERKIDRYMDGHWQIGSGHQWSQSAARSIGSTHTLCSLT